MLCAVSLFVWHDFGGSEDGIPVCTAAFWQLNTVFLAVGVYTMVVCLQVLRHCWLVKRNGMPIKLTTVPGYPLTNLCTPWNNVHCCKCMANFAVV